MDVKIRAMEKEDYAAWYEIRNLPKVCANTMAIPYISMESAKKNVELALENKEARFLVAEVDGKIVGFASIHFMKGRRRHIAGIGMMVHDDFHGRGIGTKLMEALIDLADNWYNIRRIQLEVYVDNEPAIKLYKKFGFEIEGRLRDFSFRNGEYIDAYIMARIKKDCD